MKAAVRQDKLAKQVESARNRFENLYQRAGASPAQQELLPETMQELSSALEELCAAAEELATTRGLLEAEREHYQELFEFAPDGYLVTDTLGTIQEANRAAAKLLHTRQDFLLGKPLIVFIPEQEHKAFHELLIRLEKGEEVQTWEMKIQPRDRAPFPASLTVSTLREIPSRGRRPVGLRWLVRDIAERKVAEEALRQSGQIIQGLFEYAPDAIVVIDRGGMMAHLNAQVESMFGYSRKELLGKPVEVLIPERFRERHVKHRGGILRNLAYVRWGLVWTCGAGAKTAASFPLTSCSVRWRGTAVGW